MKKKNAFNEQFLNFEHVNLDHMTIVSKCEFCNFLLQKGVIIIGEKKRVNLKLIRK